MSRIVESRVLSGEGEQRFESLIADVIARRIDPRSAAASLLKHAP